MCLDDSMLTLVRCFLFPFRVSSPVSPTQAKANLHSSEQKYHLYNLKLWHTLCTKELEYFLPY